MGLAIPGPLPSPDTGEGGGEGRGRDERTYNSPSPPHDSLSSLCNQPAHYSAPSCVKRGEGRGAEASNVLSKTQKKTRVLTKMDQGLVQAELLERGWRVQMVIASAPGNFLSYTFPTLHLPKTISPLACLTFVVCFLGGGICSRRKGVGEQ